MSAFFAAGMLVSSVTAVTLTFPGTWLEPMWRLNPQARTDLARLGPWAVVLMVGVAATCGGAAVGLWSGRRWGHRLAVPVLGANLLGDLLNAVFRGDYRTLVGLPIGGGMLAYLLRPPVRGRFQSPRDGNGA